MPMGIRDEAYKGQGFLALSVSPTPSLTCYGERS